MSKQIIDLVRSFIRRLPEEDVSFLHSRFRDRYCGDIGEAIQLIQRAPDMDRWLSSSRSANELYDKVDLVAQYLTYETSKVSSRN